MRALWSSASKMLQIWERMLFPSFIISFRGNHLGNVWWALLFFFVRNVNLLYTLWLQRNKSHKMSNNARRKKTGRLRIWTFEGFARNSENEIDFVQLSNLFRCADQRALTVQWRNWIRYIRAHVYSNFLLINCGYIWHLYVKQFECRRLFSHNVRKYAISVLQYTTLRMLWIITSA